MGSSHQSSSGQDDHDISDDNSHHDCHHDDSQNDCRHDQLNPELHVSALIDDEAEEDDGQSQSTDDNDDWQSSSVNSDQSFHYFAQLPVEIRHLIWNMFCPDLETRARVLSFTFERTSWLRHQDDWRIIGDLSLDRQTHALRVVMAVNRESRALARSYFPDKLYFDSDHGKSAVAAFNKAHDVIMLEFFNMRPEIVRSVHTQGFYDHIVNLAIDIRDQDGPDRNFSTQTASEIVDALSMFSSLKHVYLARCDSLYKDLDLKWCVQDETHQFKYQHSREEMSSFLGDEIDAESVVCWPDIHRYPDFAEIHGSPRPAPNWLGDVGNALSSNGVKLLHMVIFELDFQVMRYTKLWEIQDIGDVAWNLWYPSSQEKSEDESDIQDGEPTPFTPLYYGTNYSAHANTHGTEEEATDDDSFIDDGEIVHHGDLSDDDLDLVDESSSTVTGPAVMSSSPSKVDKEEQGEEAQAFPELRRRVAKRKVVCDSESDHDELEEPIAKRPTANRAMISDSESDHQGSKVSIRGSDQEASSAASSIESDEDEHGQNEQHMSLFERLEAARRAHPVDLLENSSSNSNHEDDANDGLDGQESSSDQVDDGADCLNGQEPINGEVEEESGSTSSSSVDPWDDDDSD
ncbi:hypothetical protein CDD82_6373 [Ophiocordyceps australis]|uniref:2EXR domain-containing protein n=1 Tax=Ophiocordyceps australis TaxID=1399860 RepID=A0A2C5YSE4_9HYPO|nr:hypothetical protein CDD82_6373 [Ophiocordyceps australis]